MDVPQHLSAFGNVKEHQFPAAMTNGVRPNVTYKMNVPERIVVAGDNKLLEARAPAAELFADRLASETMKQALQTPPTTLTVDRILKDSAEDVAPKAESYSGSRAHSPSASSNFIGDDEALELKMQLEQLSCRLTELERNVESTRRVNFLSLGASAIALIVSLLMILKKGL